MEKVLLLISLTMTCPFEETFKGEVNPQAIMDAARNLKEKNSFQPSIDGLNERGFNTN